MTFYKVQVKSTSKYTSITCMSNDRWHFNLLDKIQMWAEPALTIAAQGTGHKSTQPDRPEGHLEEVRAQQEDGTEWCLSPIILRFQSGTYQRDFRSMTVEHLHCWIKRYKFVIIADDGHRP